MTERNGLVHAILLDGKGGGTRLDWDGIDAWSPEQGMVWIHLDFTTEDTRLWLRRQKELPRLVVDALCADETRPRCDRVGEGQLISLRGVNNNPGAEPEDMVAIRLYCTANRIISTRRRHLLSVVGIVEALESGNGPLGTGSLLTSLASRLTERMSGVISQLDDEIDDLEEQVIDGAGREIVNPILDLRRQIIKLRRYIAPQREALNRMLTDSVDWIGENERLHLREALDKVSRHIEDLDSAKDRLGVAYEEQANRLAELMNSRMYLLSIVAGLFLPLGFLTGLLGVNVGGIPLADNPYGFALVVILMLALLAFQMLLFRRKRWF